MTAPFPLDPVADYLKAKQSPASGHDPVADYLAARGQPKPHDLHEEYRSGRLGSRMARENTNDAESAEAAQGASSKLGAFGASLAATGANLAQGIPGMRAVQAGARSAVRTAAHKVAPSFVDAESYRDALANITGEVEKIPTALKYAERIAGAAPLATMLPGSAGASGAIIGGADQLLNADPDQSLTERGMRTAAGAGLGYLAGKATDAVITGGKALLPARLGGTKNTAALLLEKHADRARSAKGLFDAAMAEGRAHEATPAIKAYLADPEVQSIVEGLQATDALRDVPAEDPRMLDAIYKTFSDQAKAAKKGLDAVNPNKPNLGRFKLNDIRSKQEKLLAALGKSGTKPALTTEVPAEVVETAPRVVQAERATVDGPIRSGALKETTTAPEKSLPAMMPTYEHAVKDYAKRSAEIEAVKRGYDVFRGSLAQNLPTANNLTRKTPEAFAEWAAKASPQEIAAARQGILGGAKMSMKASPKPWEAFGLFPSGSKALKASALLRDVETPASQWFEAMQNLGLLGAGSTSP